MAGIDISTILLKADYQFKGPLTENYCLQQLRGQFEIEPRYFSDKNHEIDFVLQYGAEIIPIEVKGEKDRSISSIGSVLPTTLLFSLPRHLSIPHPQTIEHAQCLRSHETGRDDCTTYTDKYKILLQTRTSLR